MTVYDSIIQEIGKFSHFVVNDAVMLLDKMMVHNESVMLNLFSHFAH